MLDSCRFWLIPAVFGRFWPILADFAGNLLYFAPFFDSNRVFSEKKLGFLVRFLPIWLLYLIPTGVELRICLPKSISLTTCLPHCSMAMTYHWNVALWYKYIVTLLYADVVWSKKSCRMAGIEPTTTTPRCSHRTSLAFGCQASC